MTRSHEDLFQLAASSFRSVWALELLLLLKRDGRTLSAAELISALRASDLVVNKALDELAAAGLVSLQREGARYMPVNEDLGRQIGKLEALYAARPDAVRRAIVSASTAGATAFADAFRLRKD